MPEEKVPSISFGDNNEELSKQKALENAKILNNSNEYKVPTEFIKIPSMGKVYAKDSMLYNMDEIEIKHMAAPQEDILTSLSLIRSGKVLDELLRSCLVSKINQEELLIGDRNALFVALRISGYGSEYLIDVTCPGCGEVEKEHTFELKNLDLNMLNLKPSSDGMNRFPYTFPDGTNVEFKFLTVRDDRDITEEMNAMKKIKPILEEKNVTTRLKKQILSLNGDENREKIISFVNSMSLKNLRAFRKFLDSEEPDVLMKQEFVCRVCGDSNIVTVPLDANFFWPSM